jgi:glutathione S-transferase
MSQELRLYTFAISHFSEKTRWMLDASGVAYREIVWTPSFHLLRARLKSGRGTTVPIIETRDEVVQDSTDILLWLERNRAPFPLLPSGAAERQAVLDIEDRFDRVGKNVIRYAYATALETPKSVQQMWLLKANAVERVLLPALFPVIEPVFRRMFRVEPEAVARSRAVIAENVAWLDERVADGRRYLAGDQLSAADITAAALLAPLAFPDEHPVYGDRDYRAVLEPAVRDWKDGKAFAWVRELYRRHRRTG